MKRTKIFAYLMVGVVLLIATLCSGCTLSSSSHYSEEEHLSRVRERAEERFLGEGSEYTGFEVYPIYNEDDKLESMLIELEPQGFMYVKINKDSSLSLFGGVSMYTMSSDTPRSWMPYRVNKGMKEEYTDEFGNVFIAEDRELIHDENGEVIRYFESHFKVAGIENERRYLLRTPRSGGGALIPAVKRGE